MHVLRKDETPKVPLLRNSIEIAAVCELHTENYSMQSMLQQTRRARAQSPDATPTQRVKHVKEGWGEVRTSAAKRERDARPEKQYAENARPAEPLAPKHARENPHNTASPQSKKTKKEKRKVATHPRNNCPLPPQCVALTGVSSRAAEKELIVQWCLKAHRAS
jgi:hypothetical protein